MSALFKNKLFLVLMVLFGLTLLSWMGLNHLNIDERIAGVLILIIAFIKVRLIIVHYMELPKTFLSLRLAFEAWIFLTGVVTIALLFN
jgi:hypothetical protein